MVVDATTGDCRISRRAMCMGLAGSLLICTMLVPHSPAYADTASDLAATQEAISSKRSELETTQANIDRLQGEIDAKAAEISQKQESYRNSARSLAQALRNNYKDTHASMSPLLDAMMSSRTIDEFTIRTQYARTVTNELSCLTSDTKRLNSELEREYADISAKKDEQSQLAESLQHDVAELESEEAELEAQASAERKAAEERPAASEDSSEGEREEPDDRPVASTFATESTDGWRTGVASAYGGWSDPSTGAVCSTATGAVCDDWSMGVAVPMAWSGYRSYFNRSVEISYNGQSVIATVNDCGYMGGGSRALDLQPGVFKAFGFSTCDAWGLRTVSYRFL